MLLVDLHGECCFRLADRSAGTRGYSGLEQRRSTSYPNILGFPPNGSPESPPPPRSRGRCPRRKRAACTAGSPSSHPGRPLPPAPGSGTVTMVLGPGLAGCSASRAALRRPSVLLVDRQRECCFRLANRSEDILGNPGLEQHREPSFLDFRGYPRDGSPESPPPPRSRSR